MSELQRRLAAALEGQARAKVVKTYAQETNEGLFDPALLQELANGPIIDPIRIYLPDGKLSKQEAEARERRWMRGDL